MTSILGCSVYIREIKSARRLAMRNFEACYIEVTGNDHDIGGVPSPTSIACMYGWTDCLP